MLRRCNVCSQRFLSYQPISQEYIDQLKTAGFKHDITSWEMLNYKNYTCPRCGVSDRDRFILQYLENEELISKKTIAEFAPSLQSKEFIQNKLPSTYTSIDKYMENVDITADITNLEMIPNESFDVILCSHVLEHIEKDELALRELRRVLRNKGQVILVVPVLVGIDSKIEDESITSAEDRVKYFGQNDHIRIYSRKDFIDVIQRSGFKCEVIEAKRYLSAAQRFSMGIAKSGALYIASKT